MSFDWLSSQKLREIVQGKINTNTKSPLFCERLFCFADWIAFRMALELYVQLDVSIVA